jgi:hypothetical protein
MADICGDHVQEDAPERNQ